MIRKILAAVCVMLACLAPVIAAQKDSTFTVFRSAEKGLKSENPVSTRRFYDSKDPSSRVCHACLLGSGHRRPEGFHLQGHDPKHGCRHRLGLCLIWTPAA